MERRQGFLSLLQLAFLVVVFSATTNAQLPDPMQSALAPVPGVGHHYIGMGAETVSPVDGSVSFDLPIQTPPGREFSFPFGIHYGSAEQYHLQSQNGPFAWVDSWSPGWRYHGWEYKLPGYDATIFIHHTHPAGAGQQWPVGTTLYCIGTKNYVFRGLDGVQRSMALGSLWSDLTYPDGCSSPLSGSTGLHGYSWGASGSNGPNTPPPLTVVDPAGTTYRGNNLPI